MEPKEYIPLLAFFLTMLFQTLFIKLVVNQKCEQSKERTWFDAVILSLPTTIAFTAVVYYFTSRWEPIPTSLNSGNSTNAGTNLSLNNGSGMTRANNMARMKNAAFGNNVGGVAPNGARVQ